LYIFVQLVVSRSENGSLASGGQQLLATLVTFRDFYQRGCNLSFLPQLTTTELGFSLQRSSAQKKNEKFFFFKEVILGDTCSMLSRSAEHSYQVLFDGKISHSGRFSWYENVSIIR
jgi:hypothetical protein